jgi:hypothetical protein
MLALASVFLTLYHSQELQAEAKKKKNNEVVSHLSSRSLQQATQLHNNYSHKFTFLSSFEIIRV